MILDIYYKIWVDCIVKAKSIPKNEKDWPFFTMIFMSMSMALNLIFILFILSNLQIVDKIYKIPINVFDGTRLDALLSFFASYLLPMLLINYFLIFNNGRYKRFLTKYKSYNGKLFISYFLGSVLILVVYFIIAFIVTKVL